MHDLSHITANHFSSLTPEAVNHGRCYVWAWIARLHVGGELCLAYRVGQRGRLRGRLVHGHAFLRAAGLYYDAERPHGVSRYDALPAARRLGRARWLCVGVTPENMQRLIEPLERTARYFSAAGLQPWPDRALELRRAS